MCFYKRHNVFVIQVLCQLRFPVIDNGPVSIKIALEIIVNKELHNNLEVSLQKTVEKQSGLPIEYSVISVNAEEFFRFIN